MKDSQKKVLKNDRGSGVTIDHNVIILIEKKLRNTEKKCHVHEIFETIETKMVLC